MYDLPIFKAKDFTDRVRPAIPFRVASDGTDHFQFACSVCEGQAVVTKVYLGVRYGLPTIFYKLYCQKCNKNGLRKIYLNDADGLFAMKISK